MSLYKQEFNPLSKSFNLVPTNTAIRMRDTVANQAALPLSGNVIGDGRVTIDNGHLYVWSIDSSTGLLTDWADQGNFIDVSWDSISGKPSSTPANIDDAVSKRHTQNSDTKLADGTANEVTAANAKDAVDKKHTQGTDQGLDTGGANAVTAAQAKAGYTHSGVITGNPHQVNKTDVGLGNVDNKSEATIITDVKADTAVADAISKKHAQGTDQGLDTGGLNATTAAEVKTAVTNSHAPHSDDQDLSGLLKLDQTIPQSIINGKPTVQGFQFNIDPTVDSFSEGKIYYDKLWKTLSLNIDSDVTLQIGEETLAYCLNNSGLPITNGQVVYISGAVGGYPTIDLADATNEAKAFVLGICTTTSIANGAYGHITIRGHVNSINTLAWTVGTSLYLSDITPGALSSTPPSAGNFDVRVGRVMIQDVSNGRIYVNVRPMSKLTDLGDVTISSPNTDDILKFNGTEWVNGSPTSAAAGKGIEFYFDGTEIIAEGNDNDNNVETLSKTPWSHSEDVETTVVNNNTILSDIYLYNTGTSRTYLNAGVWTFQLYCAVSSLTGTTEILENLMRVRTASGNVSITGAGTTRTAIASEGTPFASSLIDVGGTIDSDSYLQTVAGVYRILSRVSDTEITILVPSTYTNESTVSFSVHKRLFQITTGEINNTATAPLYTGLQLYTISSVQPQYTVIQGDKFATYRFSKTTRTSNTNVYFSYGGTTRYSHMVSPLSTLHGDLPGLQGGSGSVPSEQYYHLTSAQHTITTQSATTDRDGYLTQIDWDTFNGKQNALGFTPEDVSNKDTTTTLGTSDTKYPSQKAVKSYVDALGVTTNTIRNLTLNIMLNAFRIAQVGSLTLLKMVDQFVDEYEDETGVDTANSINQRYDSTDDYYEPVSNIDSYTKFLLHLNNNVTDSSLSPKTFTNSGVTFSNSVGEYKFGYSGIFTGGGTSRITTPAHSDFNLGSSNWTIDFWVKFDTHSESAAFVSHASDVNNDWRCVWSSASGLNFIVFESSSATQRFHATWTPADDTWYHIEFVRSGSTPYIFVDGVSQSVTIDTALGTIPSQTDTLKIGHDPNFLNEVDGKMDEVRLSVGIARHTSGFTVPSSEYIARENMTILSNAQTAEAAPTSARLVLFEEDVDAITLNTDIKGYVSRDNGATYSQVTLEDCGSYVSGAQILQGVVDISAQPSGTNMKYKIESLNNKDLKLHGAAISWK
jgi:hypothetical protein